MLGGICLFYPFLNDGLVHCACVPVGEPSDHLRVMESIASVVAPPLIRQQTAIT
jgi:hypothetical protein